MRMTVRRILKDRLVIDYTSGDTVGGVIYRDTGTVEVVYRPVSGAKPCSPQTSSDPVKPPRTSGTTRRSGSNRGSRRPVNGRFYSCAGTA